MYERYSKTDIFQAPQRFAWNILLREKQFTEEELLEAREYLSLPEMMRFQEVATEAFLRAHFAAEIDECLEVDWNDQKRWAAERALKAK